MKTPRHVKANSQSPPPRDPRRASRAKKPGRAASPPSPPPSPPGHSAPNAPQAVHGALPPAHGGTAAYLYAVCAWPPPWLRDTAKSNVSLPPGVGDPPRDVTALVFQDLAALISRVNPAAIGAAHGVRSLRRDMKAHANVLNRLVALGGTLLPATFGLIFPHAALLSARFLQPQYATLSTHLKRLHDAVEVTLKVTWPEQQALQQVVAESPDLAAAMSRPARSLDAKIELGKRVSQALRLKRDREAESIVRALSPAVRQARLNDPGSDTTVLSASLLVPRPTLPRFDKLLETIAAAGPRLQFDCVGPLPPYSFADLRL